jgi:hypothetical protein
MTYFNTSKSPCLVSHPGKAGSYKQPLIQQIAHAGFDHLGWGSTFLAIVTSSFTLFLFSVLDISHITKSHSRVIFTVGISVYEVKFCRIFYCITWKYVKKSDEWRLQFIHVIPKLWGIMTSLLVFEMVAKGRKSNISEIFNNSKWYFV